MRDTFFVKISSFQNIISLPKCMLLLYTALEIVNNDPSVAIGVLLARATNVLQVKGSKGQATLKRVLSFSVARTRALTQLN